MGFMLSELQSSLKAAGRLELLDGVAAEASSYFATLPTRHASPESTLQHARAWGMIGDIHAERARYPEAIAAHERSVRILEDLAGASGQPPAIRRALATGHANLAYCLAQRGELSGADREVALGELASDPLRESAAPDAASRLAIALVSLRAGDQRAARTDWRGASSRFLDALGTLEPIGPGESERAAWLRTVEALRGLASAAHQTTQLEDVRTRLASALERGARVAATLPDDVEIAESQCALSFDLADVLDEMGRFEEARKRCLLARELYEGLAARDPTNVRRKRNVGLCCVRLADSERRQKRWPEARELLTRAVSLYGEVLSAHPEDLDALQGRAAALLELGDLEGIFHDEEATQRAYDRARVDAESMSRLQPGSGRSRKLQAALFFRLGEHANGLGEGRVARTWFERTLDCERAGAESAAPGSQAFQDMADTQISLGEVTYLEGDAPRALQVLREVTERLRTGRTADPQNMGLVDGLGAASFRRGEAALMLGDLDTAAAAYAASLESSRLLREAGETQESLSDTIAYAHLALARIARLRGAASAEQAALKEASTAAEGIPVAPGRKQRNPRLGHALHLALAESALRAGDATIAKRELGMSAFAWAHHQAEALIQKTRLARLRTVADDLAAGHAAGASDPLARAAHLALTGRPEAAVEAYEAALGGSPAAERALDGTLIEVASACCEAAEQRPTDADTWLDRARTWVRASNAHWRQVSGEAEGPPSGAAARTARLVAARALRRHTLANEQRLAPLRRSTRWREVVEALDAG